MSPRCSNIARSSSRGMSGFSCNVAAKLLYSVTSWSLSLLAMAGSLLRVVDPARRQLHFAAALPRYHRHHLFGKKLHLVLDLTALEATEFKPTEKMEVVVADLLLHLHDLVDDELLG